MLIHHHSSSMIEKITKLDLFIYLFIYISPLNWKIEKKQILVVWLGRVPCDKSGIVNCHSVVG
jgi:hypothetical protein